MKAIRHNGRAGKHGAYNPKHELWGGYVRCQRREKNLRLKHWRGWFKQGRRSLLVIMRERIYTP